MTFTSHNKLNSGVGELGPVKAPVQKENKP